ncbi:MAG: electron transfer flavoprotein subunit beta/FixA family protein [Planctomycetia bacterium]|nr:electron transfer flavoprotein subunit beta/FixA family protein [Planctomycetia bacterium]
MKIVVLIKQVPEPGSVQIDEVTGTVQRREADAVVNPIDLHALESALRLANVYNGMTYVFSMGPKSADFAVREALAMGIDSAFLLSDRAFAGSDTYATSTILAAAIRAIVPDFDVILCGERASDGDTGQVGPEVAAALGIPVVTWVSRINSWHNGTLELCHRLEGGQEEVSVTGPALLTVNKEVGVPRLPTLTGKRRARSADVPVLTRQSLNLSLEETGQKGSPTSIVKIFRPQWLRRGVMCHVTGGESLASAVNQLVDHLEEKELI